jgi:hypothetical protein
MVDPVDLLFPQDRENLLVERDGGGEVVAERLFDDDPAPGLALLDRPRCSTVGPKKRSATAR